MRFVRRLAFAAAVLGLGTAVLRADPAAAFFDPEPPDSAAAALVEAYMGHLAAGRADAALALSDLRGMRQYLLERRLDELKARNPELTSDDLSQMSAQLQVGELNPARLRPILAQLLAETMPPGSAWSLRGYAPAPEGLDGHVASLELRAPGAPAKPLLIGLAKLGDSWVVAPALVERLIAARPPVRIAPGTPPPPEIDALIRRFWSLFQAGDLAAAHAETGAAYRARVPLLAFLRQAQDFIGHVGVPTSWSIVQGIGTEPQVLYFGVSVQGSAGVRPTLMRFRQMGQTWIIEDVQFEMPRSAESAAPAAPPAARPDLRPDLRPNLSPTGSSADPFLRPAAP